MTKFEGSHEAEPIISYADPDGLPPPLKSAIDAYVERMGFLPNALKLYMHRPEILACLVKLNNTVMRDETSHLDAGLKRRLSVICSALNHSAYCVAHNANTMKSATGGDGEGWGYSQDEVLTLLDPTYEPDDPVEAACVDYARAATADPSDVPQALLQRLADLLTPAQVVELACVVGFWKMYNTIHESLYIPLEDALLGGSELSDDEFLGEGRGVGPDAGRPQASAAVDIYTTGSCPFCRRAKRILKVKNVAFHEHRIDIDEAKFAEMTERSGGRHSVPQDICRRRPHRWDG